MNIIIFGTKDVASMAKFYFEKDTQHKAVAFTMDGNYIKESMCEGLPVIPFEEIQEQLSSDSHAMFVPVCDNKLREKKANEAKNKGYKLTSYIHSSAVCYADLGENCFVMENNTIQPYVKVGNNVIFWSGNHIGHHSTIMDNVFFTSHVVLAGHCVVEPYCYLGINSTIKDNLRLAEGTFVAMSACVTKNTEKYKLYKGIPAKEYTLDNLLSQN
jgi:sugar O-acyltransferase (sialic acid O-acetyltransferase NeuD family)